MFEGQVKIEERDERGNKVLVWRSVRPTHGKPYQFDTKQAAWDMLNMCYPETDRERLRVIDTGAK